MEENLIVLYYLLITVVIFNFNPFYNRNMFNLLSNVSNMKTEGEEEA